MCRMGNFETYIYIYIYILRLVFVFLFFGHTESQITSMQVPLDEARRVELEQQASRRMPSRADSGVVPGLNRLFRGAYYDRSVDLGSMGGYFCQSIISYKECI